jgi:iron complex transport system ATP-binding protein
MLTVDGMRIRFFGRTVIDQFSLHVQKGQMISIIGPNGSGKSTILKALTRRIRRDAGHIEVAGRDLDSLSQLQLSRIVCMLSQSNVCPADMTVGELASYGRIPHKKWYERLTKEDERITDWALQLTHMTSYRDRLVSSLSGGEAQRAWLAMALAQRPKLLLLDEPTTYLDIGHQLEVLDTVKTLNRELNLTVIMVLHDLNHAAAYSDQVCVIKDGNIQAFGHPKLVLTTALIRDVYGVETQIQQSRTYSAPYIQVLGKIRTEGRDVIETVGY